MTLLIIAALLPAIAVMAYVYKTDKAEPEPIALVLRVFGLGALSGLVAGFVESILISAFEAVIPPGVILLIITYFVGVAAVEEACKFFCLNTVKNNPHFNYVFDAIVYSVAAALGFAALENVFYVLDGGFETAVMRAIFSVPGHAADGVVMGVFYGLARHRELRGNKSGARTYYWLAFLLPVIEHGFYDAALSTESDLMALLAMAFDLAFIAIAFVLVRKTAATDEPLHPIDAVAARDVVIPPTMQQQAQQWQQQQQGAQQTQVVQQWPQQPGVKQAQPAQKQPMYPTGNWYCPQCGTPNAENFCIKCGTRRP